MMTDKYDHVLRLIEKQCAASAGRAGWTDDIPYLVTLTLIMEKPTVLLSMLYLMYLCRDEGKYNMFTDARKVQTCVLVALYEGFAGEYPKIFRYAQPALQFVYVNVYMSNGAAAEIRRPLCDLFVKEPIATVLETRCARDWFGDDELVPKDMRTGEYTEWYIADAFEVWKGCPRHSRESEFTKRMPDVLDGLGLQHLKLGYLGTYDDVIRRFVNTFARTPGRVQAWIDARSPPEITETTEHEGIFRTE
jgi:hypothetical protein